jgi:signal peptidase II
MSSDHAAPARVGITGPLRLVLTAALCLAIDLVTKHMTVASLQGRILELIPGWLEFTYVENRGAVFGLGQGRQLLFIAVSAVAIGFVIYLFTRPPRRWWYDITLGMLLAGILGNLYDRVIFGHVRDMIHALPGFHWGGTWQIPLISYPPPPDRAYFPWVFNVADSLLCVSIAILLITGMLMPEEQPGKRDDAAADRSGT